MNTLPAVLSDTHAAYAVELTNGSSSREMLLTGTYGSVWAHCCRVGETPGTDLTGYVPVGIRLHLIHTTHI
jgi:hypothetical protein